MLAEIFGPDLIIVIVVIAVVIIFGSRIPKMARNLGAAKSEFEKGVKESQSPTSDAADASDADKPQTPPPTA
jgi:Sec-independent protein translocase protein TatA